MTNILTRSPTELRPAFKITKNKACRPHLSGPSKRTIRRMQESETKRIKGKLKLRMC